MQIAQVMSSKFSKWFWHNMQFGCFGRRAPDVTSTLSAIMTRWWKCSGICGRWFGSPGLRGPAIMSGRTPTEFTSTLAVKFKFDTSGHLHEVGQTGHLSPSKLIIRPELPVSSQWQKWIPLSAVRMMDMLPRSPTGRALPTAMAW